MGHLSDAWRYLRRMSTGAANPNGSDDRWNICGIRFDMNGWELKESTDVMMSWSDSSNMSVALTMEPPESEPDDLRAHRAYHRAGARRTGGDIISVQVRCSPSCWVDEVVTKYPVGLGFRYEGSIRVTTGAHGYLIKATAAERETTGLREAAVNSQLTQLGELELASAPGPNGAIPFKSWRFDPYDPSFDDDSCNCVTDDERIDCAFPTHPLTRVRRFATQTISSLAIGTDPAVVVLSSMQPNDERALLSEKATREILWTQNQIDALEPRLAADVCRLDPHGDSSDSNLASVYLLLGIVQQRQSRLDRAIATLSRAQTLDGTGASTIQGAAIATHLARCYTELGRLLMAKPLFKRALETIEAHAPDRLIAVAALNGYGMLLLKANQPTDGLTYVTRAKDLVERLGGGQRLFQLREAAGAPPPEVTARLKVVQVPKHS